MADPKPQKEPSMEEILASIRRIISEDGDAATPAAEAEPVLELTQEVDAEGNPVVPKAESPAPVPEPAPSLAEAPEPEPPAPPEPPPAAPPALVADGPAAATAAAFAALSETLNPPKQAKAAPRESADGRTVEQLVEDLLRPMLQGWLDQNLPPLAERLVQREIERIRQRGS